MEAKDRDTLRGRELPGEGGDLKEQSLPVDTTHVRVTGGGDINLKDEGLHIELRGKPKEVRMVRLRALIEIHGTLADPEVGVEPGHLRNFQMTSSRCPDHPRPRGHRPPRLRQR